MIEIRCSGLSRPMSCAGSLFFTNLPPEERSDAAEEGTAAGEAFENLLLGKEIPSHAKNGVFIDNDMKFYTTPIAEKIRKVADGGEVLCEQRIDWRSNPNVIIRGQYDARYTVAQGRILCIDDLKYGYGIVEPKENWQLLGYAIGEVMRTGKTYEQYRLTIHQPRPYHEQGTSRTWVLTHTDLLEYKAAIDQRMAVIADGFRNLSTGPQCKYCKAAPVCPALSKAAYRGVEVVQDFVQDNISDAELAHQLDLYDRVAEVLKIRQSSLKTLAVDRLKNGKLIPGYTTEASYGDRKWKKGMDPETIKMLTGLDVTERVMLSPAKAEKLGIHKDFINGLVERHMIGMKLNKKDTSAIGDAIFGKKNPGEN